MTKYFILIVISLSVNLGYGQNQIIDSESKLPVSYVHVKSTNQPKGVISDFNGFFILDSSYRKVDSIVISCIGYTKETFLFGDLLEKKVIELTPRENNLSVVLITAPQVLH